MEDSKRTQNKNNTRLFKLMYDFKPVNVDYIVYRKMYRLVGDMKKIFRCIELELQKYSLLPSVMPLFGTCRKMLE